MNQIDFDSNEVKNRLAAYQDFKELFISNCMAKGYTREYSENLFNSAQFALMIRVQKRVLAMLKADK